MIKFPSITQFRNVISTVKHRASFMGLDADGQPIYSKHAKLPTMVFIGTVKLHGTNASIVYDYAKDELTYQSRENVLDTHNDNSGFCNEMIKHETFIRELFNFVRFITGTDEDIVTIYGEWCGGNIQKGVGISGLDKMFVIYAVRFGPENTSTESNSEWHRAGSDLFNYLTCYEFIKPFFVCTEFKQFSVVVDFERPELAQNEFVKLTLEVEDECPVAKTFGVNGIGEGIVWHCASDSSSDFVFKTKGEKHSASKVKTIAAVDVEKIEAIRDLVDTILTENRLQQMAEGIESDSKNTGEFISKCMKDCIKEETDTIVENGFTVKEFTHAAMQKARKWFLSSI